jgi:hypothetical protein
LRAGGTHFAGFWDAFTRPAFGGAAGTFDHLLCFGELGTIRYKRWQEWWEKVSAKERKEFEKAGGKRPRQRN